MLPFYSSTSPKGMLTNSFLNSSKSTSLCKYGSMLPGWLVLPPTSEIHKSAPRMPDVTAQTILLPRTWALAKCFDAGGLTFKCPMICLPAIHDDLAGLNACHASS